MRLWLLFILSAVLAAILLGSPILIQTALHNQLETLGAKQVQINDVDLNLFSGELVIKGLQFVAPNNANQTLKHVHIDLDWLPLLEKRIVIRSVQINGLQLDIERNHNGESTLAGFALPAASSEETPPSEWQFSIENAQINGTNFRIKTPQGNHTINIQRAQLGRLTQWFPGDTTPIELVARINEAPLTVKADINPFDTPPIYQLAINIDQLNISPLQPLIKDLSLLKGRLTVHSKISVTQKKTGLKIKYDAHVVLHDAHVVLHDARIETMTAGHPPLNITAKALSINGQGRYMDGERVTFDGRADITMEQVSITSTYNDLTLLDIKTAQVKQLSIDEALRIQTDEVSFSSITLAEDATKATLLKLDSLVLHPILFENQHLSIDSISIAGGETSLKRGKNNVWNFEEIQQKILAQPESTAPNTDSETHETSAEPDKPLTFTIGNLSIGNGHTLQFNDEQTTPPFALNAIINEISLSNINNSSPDELATLNADATLEKYGTLNLSGKIAPFSPKLNAQLKTSIKGLDLPVFSAYVAPALGVQVKSGLLTSDIDMNIKDDVLEGVADITLQQLIIGELTDEQQKTIDEGADMSLNKALDMLRDKNNRIHLKIPVTGDIHSPNFSTRDAIRQATSKAAKAGVMKYLSQALQPYGALITAAKIAGEQLAKIRLAPVTFTTSSSDLSTESQDFLSKVADIVQERPNIAIRLCGFSIPADIVEPANDAEENPTEKITPPTTPESQETALKTLAQKRAETVKDYLINTLKAPHERLVGCLPEIDDNEKRQGRVELYL